MKIQARLLSTFRNHSEVVPQSVDVVRAALEKDSVARRIMAKQFELFDGLRCGIRLNINVLKTTGVAVHSIHEGKVSNGYMSNKGWWSGAVVAYAPYVILKNAYFNVSQSAREKIASGEAKSPMASIDGTLVLSDELPCFEGVAVSFNPKTTHLFLDESGYAVHSAERVVIHGHRAYLSGEITYYTSETAPVKVGDSPSRALFVDELAHSALVA